MSTVDLQQTALPTIGPLTAQDLKRAIHRMHGDDEHTNKYRRTPAQLEWALFDEFTPGAGTSQWATRRIDIFAINCWPSGGHVTVAYEIKVSRSDFLNEIKQPNKRRLALLLSNQFYFVVPDGMVKRDEVPVECGLKWVKPDLSITHLVEAPHRDRLPPTWAIMGGLARRIAAIERQVSP